MEAVLNNVIYNGTNYREWLIAQTDHEKELYRFPEIPQSVDCRLREMLGACSEALNQIIILLQITELKFYDGLQDTIMFYKLLDGYYRMMLNFQNQIKCIMYERELELKKNEFK